MDRGALAGALLAGVDRVVLTAALCKALLDGEISPGQALAALPREPTARA